MLRLAILSLITLGSLNSLALATPSLDTKSFGKSLNKKTGWKNRTVEYSISGSNYRTYQPEITPTPDGGLFISLRIDHRRGVWSSDDHAVLEITVSPNGSVASAQSTLALQGLSIASDVVQGATNTARTLSNLEAAVKIGSDLAGDLTSKLLRQNIVEAGRVSYPAVLRHNYNFLVQSLYTGREPVAKPVTDAEITAAEAQANQAAAAAQAQANENAAKQPTPEEPKHTPDPPKPNETPKEVPLQIKTFSAQPTEKIK